MTILPQSSFNSGEVTPLTFGRTDLAKYRSALETCRNMVVTPHGGIVRRPGTEFIATTKNESEKVRLIPFIFNTEQAYMLEMGPEYMRVYRDGGQVVTADANTKLLLNMNGTKNTTTFTNEAANRITATTIAFVDGAGGEDTITDSANGFVAAGLTVGSITVSGSTTSDGTYAITAVVAGALTMATGSLPGDEAAGDSVTILMHPVTANGNAVVDTEEKQFGTGSLSLDGTGDYLSIPDSVDWYFVAGDFTVDFWVRFNSISGTQKLCGQFDDAQNLWYIQKGSDNKLKIYFEIGNVAKCDYIMTSAWPVVVDTWYHLAFVRTTVLARIFIDGVVQTLTEVTALSTNDVGDVGAALTVGQGGDGASYFNGRQDGFRISKGIARWPFDANFPVPTVEFPSGEVGGGGDAFELATPYIEDDLAGLQFVQSADTMYIVHPNYSPRKLTRTDHDAWSLTVISFTNKPSRWGIQSKAITGLTQANPGVVTSVGHGLADGDIVLITNVGGMTEVNGFTYTVANKAADTFQLDGVNTTNFTAYTSGGFWNEFNTNPGTVALHEERVVYAGEPGSPQTIDFGQAGDFEDMTTGTADDDGFQYTIAADQVNAVRWILSDRNLLLGTSDSPWRISGSGGDTATSPGITPTSINVKKMRGPGTQTIKPVSAGVEFVYVQTIGKTLRTLSYKFEDDAYTGTNLSVLGEHLTKNAKIVELAYQEQPFQIIWCVLDDGGLIGLTYMLDHEVVGWHRHDTGTFENIATIPGSTDDEIWFVVKRTIDSSVTRYIERLKTFWTDGDEENAFYVDSGLTYDGVSETVISGLDHLIAETVTIWSNGAAVTSKVVSATGSITLDAATTKAHIGIGMTSDTETLRLDPGDGSFQGKEKTIYELIARVFETIGFQYGKDSSSLDNKVQSVLTSDDVLLSFEGVFDTKGQVFIRKTDGGPMTILSLMPKFDAYQE